MSKYGNWGKVTDFDSWVIERGRKYVGRYKHIIVSAFSMPELEAKINQVIEQVKNNGNSAK